MKTITALIIALFIFVLPAIAQDQETIQKKINQINIEAIQIQGEMKLSDEVMKFLRRKMVGQEDRLEVLKKELAKLQAAFKKAEKDIQQKSGE
jgi:septal ring factor EnvC (AmiA/AmiB activator)